MVQSSSALLLTTCGIAHRGPHTLQDSETHPCALIFPNLLRPELLAQNSANGGGGGLHCTVHARCANSPSASACSFVWSYSCTAPCSDDRA